MSKHIPLILFLHHFRCHQKTGKWQRKLTVRSHRCGGRPSIPWKSPHKTEEHRPTTILEQKPGQLHRSLEISPSFPILPQNGAVRRPRLLSGGLSAIESTMHFRTSTWGKGGNFKHPHPRKTGGERSAKSAKAADSPYPARFFRPIKPKPARFLFHSCAGPDGSRSDGWHPTDITRAKHRSHFSSQRSFSPQSRLVKTSIGTLNRPLRRAPSTKPRPAMPRALADFSCP